MNTGVKKKVDLLEMLKDKREKRMSLKEVATLLSVSLSTVYRLIEEGKLKAIRTGERNVWVFESSVREYVESLNPLLLDE